MATAWIRFQEALAQTAHLRRHLLFGNGFSVSIHPRFGYRSLLDVAILRDRSLSKFFQENEVDFEAALAHASSYDDKERLRDAFIDAVARVHPSRRVLSPEACEACGQFIEMFAGAVRGDIRGKVFTTNYDLLLYWVLMQRRTALKMYDGFDRDAVWDESRTWKTFIFYLHGALHHYEVPFGRLKPKMQQRKLLWREDAGIIQQVRANLDQGRFPIFVSEGDAADNASRIGQNPYLRRTLKAFRECCSDPDSALFIVGHSLAKVDAHITDVIGRGASSVYVGVYNEADERRANQLTEFWNARHLEEGRSLLQVHFFHSAECSIWKSVC